MSTLFTFLSRSWRKRPLLAGLVLLVLIFLSCAYLSTEAQSETIQAERLVGFHKKLQQINDFEPVKFLPVRSSSLQTGDDGSNSREYLDQMRISDEAIEKIEDGDNIEYVRPDQYPVPVYVNQQNNYRVPSNQQVMDTQPPSPYIPQHRIVHFDLKGAPPTIDYMKKVVVMSKELGATGVLIEYEDMFPWTGRLELTAHGAHYSLQQVTDFVKFCEDLGLEVIPLVQTFGHLEYVLKHEEFSHLRDVAEMPESICPCHEGTMDLIQDIIDQVMSVHKKANYLHIGCDEVYHLGECQPCSVNMSSRNEIFTQHVSRVATYARKTHNVTPIVWDDMLRNLIIEELKPLAKLVEPMVWVYAPDVERFAPSYTWDRFNQVFDYMWTASAFKGAHGETLVVPPLNKHLENNLNWLTLMREEEPRLAGRFRGIVLTGWQRYDHFAVLCELLPAGLPSLAVNLLATSHGYFNDSLKDPLLKELSCPEDNHNFGAYGAKYFDFDFDPYFFNKLSWCNFPGQRFYKVLQDLINTEEEVGKFVKHVEKDKGWMTAYNARHNMSSPFRIEGVLEDWHHHSHTVSALMRNANTALLEMFDHYTASEWIEQKVYPMFHKLSQIRNLGDTMKTVKFWPSRPYPPLDTLTGMGIGVPVMTTTQRPRQRIIGKSKNVYYQPQANLIGAERSASGQKSTSVKKIREGLRPLANSFPGSSERLKISNQLR